MRIGLIGAGTVGGGVIDILELKSKSYKEELGLDLDIYYIKEA